MGIDGAGSEGRGSDGGAGVVPGVGEVGVVTGVGERGVIPGVGGAGVVLEVDENGVLPGVGGTCSGGAGGVDPDGIG